MFAVRTLWVGAIRIDLAMKDRGLFPLLHLATCTLNFCFLSDGIRRVGEFLDQLTRIGTGRYSMRIERPRVL